MTSCVADRTVMMCVLLDVVFRSSAFVAECRCRPPAPRLRRHPTRAPPRSILPSRRLINPCLAARRASPASGGSSNDRADFGSLRFMIPIAVAGTLWTAGCHPLPGAVTGRRRARAGASGRVGRAAEGRPPAAAALPPAAVVPGMARAEPRPRPAVKGSGGSAGSGGTDVGTGGSASGSGGSAGGTSGGTAAGAGEPSRERAARTAAGAGTGGDGADAGGGTTTCTFTATAAVSTAIPTVATVSWTTSAAVADIRSAEIDYGLRGERRWWPP